MGWFTKEEHKKVVRVGGETYIVDVTEAKKEAEKYSFLFQVFLLQGA